MNVRESLSQGQPLLFDGAMGTVYAALPGRSQTRCELANLQEPQAILSIHRAYLDAGCRAIKTNTFSAGADLTEGREELAADIVAAACRLANEAARPYDAAVFGDIGPVPEGKRQSRGELYCRLADLFLSQGITCFLAETLPGDDGVLQLARHIKARCPQAFLIVSYAVGSDGVTREGQSGRALLRSTAAIAQVDAVGFNCVSGPHHLLQCIRGLELGDKLLSVMPNAGYPSVLGRRVVFGGTPAYFAGQMAQIVQGGARIVGGCCGTTPAHIAAVARVLGAHETQSAAPKREGPTASARRRAPLEKSNPLWDKLSSGERVIAVELDPPDNDDISPFMERVGVLRDAGADAVTISDCPIGRPRADSSLLSCKIKRELGMEPLPHMTCRDRNRNATRALLLGLSMEDVHNVLLVTGDPIPTAQRDEVKSVFDFNSRKLIRYVRDLNETALSTPFRIFGALNVNARNFAVQLALAQEKEACGASGFLTQPVYSREALDNLRLARQTLRGRILGGIMPIVSHRNALFLCNEIAGMGVSEEIVSRYEGKDRREAEELAVRISVSIAREMAPYVDGYYLMTPFNRVKLIERIIREIR